MPERIRIYQDRMLATGYGIVTMAIDRPKEVGPGNQSTNALIEPASGCFTPTGKRFGIFHPAVIFPPQDSRCPQLWPERSPVHRLQ
jgi:hypothetical protein